MIGHTSDGTRYLVEGSGAPIVLVHGVGMDLTMWDDVAMHLKRHAHVVRYDMLGHGESAKPAGPYRLGDFVVQLKVLIAELRLESVTLVGFSMGGLVAQGYALERPVDLARLILLNTVFNRSPAEREAIAARVEDLKDGGLLENTEAAIERWFTPDYRARSGAVVEKVRQRMMTNDLEAYISAYEVFATSDAELVSSVVQIRVPTLVVTGEQDQRSTTEMALALAAKIPQAQAIIIPAQRHLTPLEIPEKLVHEIILREQSLSS